MAEANLQIFRTLMDKSADQLAGETDPEKIKETIASNAEEASNHPIDTDPWIYRGTVFVLGVAVLVVVYAYFSLASGGKGNEIPEALVALGATAIGALAGLLAPTASR